MIPSMLIIATVLAEEKHASTTMLAFASNISFRIMPKEVSSDRNTFCQPHDLANLDRTGCLFLFFCLVLQERASIYPLYPMT